MDTNDREIVTIRTVNYPIQLVYQAWSDRTHLKKWWGPKGFTNTFHRFDFTPGGKWIFVMHGPDKGKYQNECEFIDIRENSLITWKRFSQPLFDVVVTFEEISPKQTKVVFRQVFTSTAEYNKIKAFAADKNEEVFDRLQNELSKMA